jgi:hypothetical protein
MISSIGRRPCAGQKKAAASIAQSRRWSDGRVKGLLCDGFFLCHRLAGSILFTVDALR